MKQEILKRYVCDECGESCSQVYGDNVEGRYTFRCVRCAFPPKKRS